MKRDARQGTKRNEVWFRRQPVVLVAEDNELFLKMVRVILERAGFAVLCTKDGQEALEMFKLFDEEIDVVVTDLMMPRLGGADLCKRAKQRKPRVPVLLITGVEPESVEHADKLGFDGALKKPFAAEELLALIRAAVPDSLKPMAHAG